MMSFLICGLRFSHSPKASSPMLATVFGMLMIVSELHRANAHSPMLVTLSGMLMLVSDLHPENAESPMLVTLSGMLMLVRDLHPENADIPMLVTPSGMLMLVREWHSEKAFCPILFTLLGMLYVLLPPIYAIMIVLSSLNKVLFSYINDFDSLCRVPCQPANGFPTILIGLFGILTLVSDVQP